MDFKRVMLLSVRGWILGICLLWGWRCGAGQFVELTAEIEMDDWDYRFFTDSLHSYPGAGNEPSIFRQAGNLRCVVGTNEWMIEGRYPNQTVQHWFTGTNIVTRFTPINPTETNTLAQAGVRAGEPQVYVEASADGNPGRPGGVADLMPFDYAAKASWLAFCSGPALRREGRRIYPTSDQWKESSIFFTGWTDRTTVFPDELGLPKSISLVTTNRQIVFQYQVRRSTNVLGWSLPLEFYAVQYLGSNSIGWRVDVTIKGRVTSIGAGKGPILPVEVQRAATR